jgi:hypothetical protein
MLTYSFISHPYEKLLNSLESIVPGINEGYALFCSSTKEITLLHYTSTQVRHLKIKSTLPAVQKFRKERLSFNWLNESMLSFIERDTKTIKSIKQLSITDEEEAEWLCIKTLSPYDHLYDALFLKIDHSGVFELSKSGSTINAQQRNIIGKMMSQWVKYRTKEEYQNLETHTLVLNNILLQQRSTEELQDEHAQLKSNYKKSILYFADTILKQLSEKHTTTIRLSDKAQEYLLSKDFDLDLLEKIIVQAAHMAINLSLSQSKEVVIQPENILVNQREELVIKSSQNTKHSAIIELLDRYEEAAQKAKIKEWKINGNTVAQLCSPPVTPAAITFNLKKYQKQINVLLQRYDERWLLIRSEFKPLTNIIAATHNPIQGIKTA